MRDAPPTSNKLSERVIRDLPAAMFIVDASVSDRPITFVNRAFTRQTGFSPEMAVGRDWRFLDGPDTDPAARHKIDHGLARGEAVDADIMSRRADGTVFMNHLNMTPIFAEDGQLTHFIGVQTDLSRVEDAERQVEALRQRLRGLQGHVKAHLAVIFRLVRLLGRQSDPAEMVDVLASRVQAISLLYDNLDGEDATASGDLDLGAYLCRLGELFNAQQGPAGVRVHVDADRVDVDQDDAARVGLIVSEMLTNAAERVAFSPAGSEISLRLSWDKGRARVVIADHGGGVVAPSWPELDTVAGRIVAGLVFQLGGELGVMQDGDGIGTQVSVAFDVERAEARLVPRNRLS
ncbi:MAG: PAS domain-containing protein [Pseudomonadota bacterium]